MRHGHDQGRPALCAASRSRNRVDGAGIRCGGNASALTDECWWDCHKALCSDAPTWVGSGIPRDHRKRKTRQAGGFRNTSGTCWNVPICCLGARERTRTSTKLPPLAPEASASTNSATRAGCRARMLRCDVELVNAMPAPTLKPWLESLRRTLRNAQPHRISGRDTCVVQSCERLVGAFLVDAVGFATASAMRHRYRLA